MENQVTTQTTERPEPLDWKIDGAGRAELSFRAIPSGATSPRPSLLIRVDAERETAYGENYINVGHIDLHGDAAVKFARELMFGQATAESRYWRLVCDNTEPYQFVLYGTNTPRALRRFSIGLLSDIPHMARQMLAVLRWGAPEPKPEPAPTPAPTPQPEPVVKLVEPASQDDPRDARIRELEEENRQLRAMVSFLEQYRPQ